MLSHYCLDIIRSERQPWSPSVANHLGFVVSVGQCGAGSLTTKQQHLQVASPDLFTIIRHLSASPDWTMGLIEGLISSRTQCKLISIFFSFPMDGSGSTFIEVCGTEGVINTGGSESLSVLSLVWTAMWTAVSVASSWDCLSPCHQYYYQDIQFCSDLFH